MSIKIVATNRKANHNYKILDKFESGIVLHGTEVKSIRDSKASIKEAYIKVFNNELFIIGMNISEYKNSGYAHHEPTSDRKLLMHKKEILKLRTFIEEKGKTLIPLRMYFKKGLVKLEFGLAEGKKKWDKRHAIRDKELKRTIDRKIKESNRL